MKLQNNPSAMESKIMEAADYLASLHPREPGLHVSDIIQCRRKSWYARQTINLAMEGEEPDVRPYFPVAPHTPNTQLMFMLGQGHHSILQADRDEKKAVMEFHGTPVTGSIDDWVTDDPEHPDGYPEEYKTTRSSLAKSPYPAMHYIEQGASYAVMTGAEKLRVSVFYLFGDWRAAKFPQGRTTDISFSKRELVDWHMEMGRRVKLILGDSPPPFSEKRDWECDYCPFSQKKGGPCEAVKLGKGSVPDFFQVDDQMADFLGEEE